MQPDGSSHPLLNMRETTVLLVRHGHTAAVGQRLVGRLPGVPLSELGRAQANRLAVRLQSHAIAAIYSSPLDRAIETAEPIAQQQRIVTRICEGLIEIDFGAWTGRKFEELEQEPAWHTFNTRRSTATVPGGERAVDVQNRILSAIDRFRQQHPAETVVAISHADVIRSAVAHVAGVSLDAFQQFEIGPASVTALQIGDECARLLYVNEPGRLLRISHIPQPPGTRHPQFAASTKRGS
jgi:probable phosphoglycerate mutase